MNYKLNYIWDKTVQNPKEKRFAECQYAQMPTSEQSLLYARVSVKTTYMSTTVEETQTNETVCKL